MFGKQFHLNEETMAVVEEIGQHMPGGFFIYKAEAPGELLFANNALFEIFGCDDLDDFMKLTGYTFEGMVHPEDYAAVSETINKQLREKKDKTDYAEYRIIRKDGSIHWVDDYGHYTETEKYGGIYYVFISDITEKRERMESHLAMHHATIRDLSESNEKLASERITFIRVESKPGEGSKFTVELDLQTLEETVQETKSDRVISAENLAGTRILLVEDNDINAEIAMMVLTQYQAQAERACNGQEGADKVRKNGEGYYDAVLMDIQMPVMNGYEATRAIRSEKGAYYSELPIIAMSANTYDEDVRECLEAGMNAHIAKPFDPGKLREILHRHIHTGDRQEEGPGAG